MFGSIIDISENMIIIENTSGRVETNLLNIHVVFSDVSRKVIGEIIKITKKEFTIMLLGEIRDTYFQSGIIKAPAMNSECRIIYQSELELLIGSQDYTSKNQLLIGHSVTYEGYKVTVKMNSFFSNHFAILGNTGSGKSCAVARIIQNIFYYNKEAIPVNAHLLLFDIYGEYQSALKKMANIPGIKIRNYTTEVIDGNSEVIAIPPYFLDVDDLAILLDVQDSSLLSILEKTLQYVYIFKSTDPKAEEYKNDIIAKCLMDILSSGKNSTQIRDQIISILIKYNTKTLNLNSEIAQPGYIRTLQQCLNIDAQGKINAIQFIMDFLSNFNKVDLQSGLLGDNFIYDLDDIYYALEFALLSEGTFNSQTMYDKANNLKVRLHAIINSNLKKYFEVKNSLSKEEYIRQIFLTPLNEQAQIVNMNFDFVDDRFTKILTKILSRLFFQFATNLKERGSFPIHIILEEAHRYVNHDSDTAILGYNIFDRITKEGRKYGVIMGFVTQRPSELSETVLSQCSNFISLKLFHPEDLKIISSMASNVTQNDIEKIKLLRPGTALAFGSSFPLPVITKFDLPDPTPNSSNISVSTSWF
jgi:hypothetical protein